MNHHRHDDPFYHQSTSAATSSTPGTSSSSYSGGYDQKMTSEDDCRKTPDATDSRSSLVEADQMNAFMDSYFGDIISSTGEQTKPQHLLSSFQISKSKADEDLETLLKETDDMQDIQNAIQMEQIEMAEKYKEDRLRQKRAAAARSRYQRMTENERRLYNQRRRLKQLGVNPDSMDGDLDTMKKQVKEANAKKAEAARMRYHRMTPEQKRDYNHRRTEAFRRRRQEEEMLLSTPAGRISAEALEKAQQIMVRNARKAESARLRYQRMSAEDRKAYNTKRAAAKRDRRVKVEDFDEFHAAYMDDEHPQNGSDDYVVVDDQEEKHLEDISASNAIHHLEEEDASLVQEEAMSEEHMLNVINQVAHPPAELDIFAQMENEVLRRTKKANATIMKNHHQSLNNAIVGGIQYDLTETPVDLICSETLSNFSNLLHDTSTPSSSNEPHPNSSIQDATLHQNRVIDEQTLHDIVRTGIDSNGRPVEIRTVDGQRITCLQDLFFRSISHGQTVLITERVEHKSSIPPTLQNGSLVTQDNHVNSTSGQYDMLHQSEEYEYERLDHITERERAAKARRAERARSRYHRMSLDKRRETNARRAMMLRKARARDEELMKIAETTPAEEIDEKTSKAITQAQQRRARKAEQARSRYRRMNSEEKRRFNASRDAQKNRKKATKALAAEPESMPEPTADRDSLMSSPAPPVTDPEDDSSFFYGLFASPPPPPPTN